MSKLISFFSAMVLVFVMAAPAQAQLYSHGPHGSGPHEHVDFMASVDLFEEMFTTVHPSDITGHWIFNPVARTSWHFQYCTNSATPRKIVVESYPVDLFAETGWVIECRTETHNLDTQPPFGSPGVAGPPFRIGDGRLHDIVSEAAQTRDNVWLTCELRVRKLTAESWVPIELWATIVDDL